jgi:hypothetical protein
MRIIKCVMYPSTGTVAVCPRWKDATITSGVQEISLSKIYFQLSFEVLIPVFKVLVLNVIWLVDFKITVFWDVTPCSLVGSNLLPSFDPWRVAQFCPENWGSWLQRNVDTHGRYPRRLTFLFKLAKCVMAANNFKTSTSAAFRIAQSGRNKGWRKLMSALYCALDGCEEIEPKACMNKDTWRRESKSDGF